MKLLPISYFDKNPKSTKPIWGINTAADSDIQISGDILVAIANPNGGQPDRLLVPRTWLPQELTRVINRRRLLEAAEFRSAVDNGLIGLITIEDAERLMRQEGAQEEKDRLRERARHVRQAGQARTLSDSKTEIARADGVVDEDDEDNSGRNKTVIIDSDEDTNVAKAAARGVEDHEPGIAVEFKIWVDRLCTSKDILAKNDIKSRRKFSPAELRFLQKSLPRNFTQALTMVNANVAKLSK